ncbi:MAG: hypothetical protein ACYDHW_13360 [Syntrophorhabdaceae bacterium]
MKKDFMKLVAIVVLCASFLYSCASLLPNPDDIKTEEDRIRARSQCIAMYTAGGALGGAIIGGLIGGDWKGAGIGAAIGGGIGFAYAWGKCLSLYSTLKSSPAAGYQETAQKIGYNQSQGELVKIQSFTVSPSSIGQGGSVKLRGSYYVMAPPDLKEIKVTETRIVKYFDPSKNEWTELGQVDQQVTAAPGTRVADGNFDIPKDVPEGRYRIAFMVNAEGKSDMVERELNVRKATSYVPELSPIHALTKQPLSYRAETVLIVEEVSMLHRTAR